MNEFEKCSICGKGNLLPMSYMRCDTCDSELAGARELRINKRLVHDADTISLKNEIKRLTQQLEEAKRDAERYRWIRTRLASYRMINPSEPNGICNDHIIDDSIKESND